MTFDDGILKIYRTVNTSSKGDKPVIKLTLKAEHYYGFDSVSYTRYYTAMQAHQQIDSIVRIWQDRSIGTDDICVLEDGEQHRIGFVQHVKDDDGICITRLTLSHLNERYEING